MEKVLIADFSSGKDRVTVRGLWQFDRGVKLKVIGINAADVNRVDFAPVVASEAVPVVVVPDEDGTFTVSIPGAATKSPYDVTAYIYVDTAEYGYTVKAVSMPVILRPEAGKSGEEEKPDPFGEVVEKVSGYATEARDSARAAAESEKAASESATQAEKAKEASRESAEKAAESKEAAATSATAAAESASQARESATAARSAADQAAKSATAAAESETTAAQQAQNAAQSATNAARSAESAAQSAETAKTAADAAEKSASAAQQAAGSASESASTATAAAQTVTTAAGKAAESATLAGQSAGMASQKATAAETSAGNAAVSAAGAAKSATAAGDSASAAKVSEMAAEEAAQTAQEQAGRIEESAEQIEKNKAGVAALEEEKADKTSLAQTDRKLDALWKLNQGVSYQFEEDSAEAYQKTVPTGAKLASVKSIGGKTIVWNQLFENKSIKTTTVNGVTFTNNGDGSYTVDGTATDVAYVSGYLKIVKNHKYYMKSLTGPSESYKAYITGTSIFSIMTDKGKGYIDTALSDGTGYFVILYAKKDTVVENVKIIPMVFDLTKMFGSGNEPATVEEFEAMFPEGYYSYNEGELISAGVNEIVERGRNLIDARKVVSKTGDVNFENLGNGKIHVHGSTNTRSEIDPVYVDEKDFPPGQYRINVIGISGISVTFVKKNKATGEKTWCNDKFEITDNDTPLYWYIMAVKCTVDTVITPQIAKGNVEIPALAYHDPVSFAVPEAVRQLPGYGWSAGNVCNEVDWESKKYIQRIGHYKFSEKTALRLMKNNSTDLYCAFFAGAENVKFNIAVNGILSKNFDAKYVGGNTNAEGVCCETAGFLEYKVLYKKLGCTNDDNDDAIIAAIKKYMIGIGEEANYPLIEPVVTDISNLISDAFQEPFEVEAGGTLTFKNSNGDGFQIPVPSEEEYIVSLAEVGGVTE